VDRAGCPHRRGRGPAVARLAFSTHALRSAKSTVHEWGWQWVLAPTRSYTDPATGPTCRHARARSTVARRRCAAWGTGSSGLEAAAEDSRATWRPLARYPGMRCEARSVATPQSCGCFGRGSSSRPHSATLHRLQCSSCYVVHLTKERRPTTCFSGRALALLASAAEHARSPHQVRHDAEVGSRSGGR
jgi:hypothetical protein